MTNPDIFLLSLNVGAIKKSEASYNPICSCFVKGPAMTISPLATIISDAVNVAVGEEGGAGVEVAVTVGVSVTVIVDVVKMGAGVLDGATICKGMS